MERWCDLARAVQLLNVRARIPPQSVLPPSACMLSSLYCPPLHTRLSLWNHERVVREMGQNGKCQKDSWSPMSAFFLRNLGSASWALSKGVQNRPRNMGTSFVWPPEWRFYPWEETILKPEPASPFLLQTSHCRLKHENHGGFKEGHFAPIMNIPPQH